MNYDQLYNQILDNLVEHRQNGGTSAQAQANGNPDTARASQQSVGAQSPQANREEEVYQAILGNIVAARTGSGQRTNVGNLLLAGNMKAGTTAPFREEQSYSALLGHTANTGSAAPTPAASEAPKPTNIAELLTAYNTSADELNALIGKYTAGMAEDDDSPISMSQEDFDRYGFLKGQLEEYKALGDNLYSERQSRSLGDEIARLQFQRTYGGQLWDGGTYLGEDPNFDAAKIDEQVAQLKEQQSQIQAAEDDWGYARALETQPRRDELKAARRKARDELLLLGDSGTPAQISPEEKRQIEERRRQLEAAIEQYDAELKDLGRDVNYGRVLKNAAVSGYAAGNNMASATFDALLGEDSILGGMARELAVLVTGEDKLAGKNPFTRMHERDKAAVERNAEIMQRMTAGNDTAVALAKHTQSFVQNSPFILVSLMAAPVAAAQAGATMSTAGLEYLATINSSPGLQAFSTMAAKGMQSLAANPNAQYSFLVSYGSSRDEALEDGADPFTAEMYALLNSTINAMIEVGGSDAALGGMQALPAEIQQAISSGDKNAVMAYIKSIVDEVGEEELQGFFERGLKSMYKDVKVFSEADPDAIFNPDVIMETAKDTAIDTAISAGVQTSAQYLSNAALNAGTQPAPNITGIDALAENVLGPQQAQAAAPQTPGITGIDALLETAGIAPANNDFRANQEAQSPSSETTLQTNQSVQDAQEATDGIPAPQTGAESDSAAPVELNSQERPSSFLASVKEKLKNLVFPGERKAAIDKMSFGEQVAAIENGQITASEKPFVNVSATTPQTLIDKAGASQLPVIMSYDNAYLSARDKGTRKGHYHDLGADIMSQIPEKMNEPLAIIRQENGRIAEVLPITDKEKKLLYVVVELNAEKDIDGRNSAYNLVISSFGAGDNYINNQLNMPGNTVIENNLPGEASQVNPQRIELPGTINEAASGSDKSILSSQENIPQTAENSNTQKQNSGAELSQPVMEQQYEIGSIPPDNIGNDNSGPAPIPAGAKLSQFWTNTLTKAEEAVGAPDRVKQPLWYMPKSEVQSLAEASSRLSADASGEVERLIQAEAWSGVQTDMASQLANQFYHEGRETGDMSGYMAWRKVMQNHITETARGLQAIGKYSRATAESIVSEATDALNGSEISAEEKTQKLNDISDFADAYEKAVGGHESGTPHTASEIQSLKDLIMSLNEYRHTGTFIKKNFEKLVDRINDGEYLDKFAQKQMLAITSDAMAQPSDNIGGKLKTIQVLNMLTSLATTERNLSGNFSFSGLDMLTQDIVGYAVDSVVSKFTGKRSVGLNKGVFSKRVNQAGHDAMLRSVLEVAADVNMGNNSNRYGMSTSRQFKMSGGKLEQFYSRWEQLLSYALTSTDRLSRGRIEAGTAEGLEAIQNSGLSREDISEIAEQNADYRLFQNEGVAANISQGTHDVLNLLGFGGEVQGAQRKGGFGLGDLVNVFPKVPANLGVKLLEHSPANVAKGLAELFINAHNGTLSAAKQNQAVMDISRGLSGTVLIMAFTALAKAGFLRDYDDEDDYDVIAQNTAEGKRGLQWNLSATLRGTPDDWRDGDVLVNAGFMEPLDAFLRTGVMIATEDEDASLLDMGGDVLQAAWQSLKDLPVMNSISNIEDMIQTGNALGQGGAATAADVAAGFAGDSLSGLIIPAPLRHLANATDPYSRDTSSTSKAQASLNRVLNSIPGLRQKFLDVKTDAYGQPVSNGSVGARISNVVLPGRVDTLSQSKTSAAIEALVEATGKKSLVPSRNGPKTTEIEGETVVLTDAQRSSYGTVRGLMYNEAVNALLASGTWVKLSQDAQLKAAQDIKSYAEDAAKAALADNLGMEYDSDYAKVQDLENPFAYLSTKAAYTTAEKAGDFDAIDALLSAGGMYDKLGDDAKELLDSGSTTARLDQMYEAARAKIGSERWTEIYEQKKAIDESDRTATQKATDFAYWLDQQTDLNERQKSLLREQFRFYSQNQGEAKKYDQLSEVLPSDTAKKYYDAVSGIDSQKTADIVSAIVNAGGSTEDQLKAIQAYDSSANQTTYNRFLRAQEAEIGFKKFSQFLQKINEIKGDKSSPSKADVKAAIKAMGWSKYESTVLAVYYGK